MHVGHASIIVGCFVLACGGDSGESPPSERHAQTTVAALSAEDAQSVCEEFVDEFQRIFRVERIRELACTETGLSQALEPEQCATIREECIASDGATSTVDLTEAEDIAEQIDPSVCADAVPSPSCMATVAEIFSCLDQLSATFDGSFDVSCDIAGNVSEQQRLQMQSMASGESIMECGCMQIFELAP